MTTYNPFRTSADLGTLVEPKLMADLDDTPRWGPFGWTQVVHGATGPRPLNVAARAVEEASGNQHGHDRRATALLRSQELDRIEAGDG